MKKKNVLFLHLESISRANLWQYRNELGTVWRLMNESYRFNRFYTNATSTVMTKNDLFFGDTSVCDSSPVYSWKDKYYNYEKYMHLWTEARIYDKSYSTANFLACAYGTRQESVADRKDGTWNVCSNHPVPMEACIYALNWFKKIKNSGGKFFAHFADESSHLANPHPHKDNAPGVPGRLRTAYSLIDASLNYLLKGMAEMGLWEDTIIVGYGDHGDEPWAHGLHRGYGHAISPYTSLTKTPMFIYYPEVLGPGQTDQLASIIDLKRTVLGLLFPHREPVPLRTPFEGIDLFCEKRTHSFAQNMYALQRECTDPEQGMTKGYAATDGTYRLVANSGAVDPALGGLELYCEKTDPENMCNLLQLFNMDPEGTITSYSESMSNSNGWANNFLNAVDISEVREKYQVLRTLLQEYVQKKEKLAVTHYKHVIESDPETWAKDVIEIVKKINPEYAREPKEEIEKARNAHKALFCSLKNLYVQEAPHGFSDDAFNVVVQRSSHA